MEINVSGIHFGKLSRPRRSAIDGEKLPVNRDLIWATKSATTCSCHPVISSHAGVWTQINIFSVLYSPQLRIRRPLPPPSIVWEIYVSFGPYANYSIFGN